ncbi:PepSY domain-containing protein [bacterium]|nr:MAG: PepSY domain-containing protein [bacterium]
MLSFFSWKKIRSFLNTIHLWLGIGASLILFIVCLTGTIYTFQPEITRWMDSEKYTVSPADSVPILSIEALKDSVGAQLGATVASVSFSKDKTEAYQFSVRKEGERRGTTYLVNPYTAEILGDTKSTTSEFFMVMFRLHRWLLLDTKIGRPIVGWSTVIFAVIVFSGMILWFPVRVKSWRNGLKVNIKASWKRINHDLHNTLGFYSSIFLLIMALTGLQWSFDWYREGLTNLLGVKREAPKGELQPEISTDSLQVLTITELIQITDSALPFDGSYYLDLSSKSNEVSIRKYSNSFFASHAPDRVTINRYNGNVTSVERFADKPFNEQIASSIKALHVGNVFGTFSKIIYFLACLVATSLPVTGIIIWLNKRKGKRVSSSHELV